MAAHRDDWMGAQTKLDFDSQKTYDGIEIKDGQGPFLVALMKNCPRFGAAAFPMTTVGCFISNMSENALLLAAFKFQHVADQGIAMADVQTFLATTTGLKMLKSEEDSRYMYIPKNTSVFVPWGWYALPCFYSATSKGTKADDWMYVVHLPLMTKQAVGDLAGSSMLQATNNSMVTHLAPLQQAMWKNRKAAWDQFYAQVSP